MLKLMAIELIMRDSGGMIAHAYATQYPDETASVCYGECPIPGSSFYEKHKRDTQFWHFLFHVSCILSFRFIFVF